MEVINPRVALLSNYEVLTLLRELESDHLERSKTALRIKKEEDAGTIAKTSPLLEISENLRTIEVEAIQHLSAEYLPTSSQHPAGIVQLTKNLSNYALTKAEKLQIVNLAPTLPVELYVIVEELEDRLGERMDELLAHVQSSLALPPASTPVNGKASTSRALTNPIISEQRDWDYNDEYGDDAGTEIIFEDTGEGVGVEGDLDIDDD